MNRLLRWPCGLLAPLALLAWSPACAAAGPVERAIEVDGVSRSYLISVPAAWDGKAAVAVLFVFHGAGSDAESMVRATGFEAWAGARAGAATEPTLIVYPRALRSTRRYDVDGAAGRVSADVRFVDLLLERLRQRFPVDAARVYATGFSNGAALCYRLAADRAQVFAAIAPVAGFVPASLTAGPPQPVPTLHAHGSADRRVPSPRLPLEAGDRVAAWARWNGCTGEPALTVLGGTAPLVVRRAAFTGPTPASDTLLLLFEGQDHAWPGGAGGVLSREVWAFLRAHPRSAARGAASR